MRGETVALWPGEAPGIGTAEPREVPTITLYPADRQEPHGAVVVCPGGGYGRRAPHEGEPVALRLNQAGISAFVLNYRTAPYQHPWPLTDGLRGVRWARHHAPIWNIDPHHIGILGFSAGGHLASTVATHFDAGDPDAADPVERQSSRPDAAVLCYAVISFLEFGHTGSMQNLLGADPDPELRRNLSNETQVTGETPPTFLWHTGDDPGVKVENSLLFATRLREHNVPFELHVYQTGRHGLGLAPEDDHVASWAGLCCEWLAGLGF